MSYLLLILVLIAPAFADLDKIQIKNLDVNYVYPEGSGEFEKMSIGLELSKQTYPVQIYRREKTFDIISPFIDFQWVRPFKFVHDAQKVTADKMNLKVDHGEHYARGESLTFTGEKTQEIQLKNYNFTCQGTSVARDAVERLKSDCLDNLEASITHLELPFEFFNTLAAELPEIPAESAEDMPADDFALSLKKGDFYSHLRVKVILRAYLKIWGHTQFEEMGKTLAIRVDEIKYGILPVTSIVMNELRRQTQNNPAVKVDPPWIRINLGTR